MSSDRGGGWHINLWTNEIQLIPKTVEWAQNCRIKVRDVRELEVYKEYQKVFLRMLDDNVVMASDLARFLILYEVGGLYLDFD